MANAKFKKLFEPARLAGMTLKNHLVSAPMLMNYATDDGFVTPRLVGFYDALARGGVGLIIAEGSCVEAPRGKVRGFQMFFDDDKFIPGLRELVSTVKQHDVKIAIQLMHSGSNSEFRISHMEKVGPSNVNVPGKPPVRELTIPELKSLAQKFAQAAERAKRAGFDGVEIHGGHSYLIAPFMSSATNKRTDIYGGSLENRARFLMEIYHAVRESVGKAFPVWCRINGKEFGTENGVTIEESQAVAVMLEKAGADAIVLSCGGTGKYAGYSSAVMYDPPGNLVHLAEAVKQRVKMPVIAVGKLTVELAEKVLQEGKADLVAMGRSLLADLDLPRKAAEGRLDEIRPCIWCRVCGDVYLQDKDAPVRCQVNATLGYEKERVLRPAVAKRRILVVGGGPAGMEAARVAAERGHEVMLYERKSNLGGQMAIAAMVPPKTAALQEYGEYLERQLRRLGVRINLGTEVTPILVQSVKPDAVILATGLSPAFPNIPGLDSSSAFTVEAAFDDKSKLGESVVILGGGMIGCDVADYLSDKGKKITVSEGSSGVVADLGGRVISRVSHRLREKGVSVKTGARCFLVKGRDITFLDSGNQTQTISADSIVIATEYKPNRDLCDSISRLVPDTHLIGDCVRPAWILEAVEDGFRIAREV